MRSEEPHLYTQSWRVVVSDGDAQKSTSIETPFVLVGKHKDCQIQIEKHDFPDFAYLVVSTNNKIEAWPLAVGIEFLSLANEQLPISVESVTVSFTAENSLGSPQVYDLPKVLIARRGKIERTSKNSVLVTANKRVLIIGSRRPSNCRIRGAQLAICDIALVYDGFRVWIIDLVAERSPPLTKRIDLFPLAPTKVNVGGLSISISLPTPDTGPAETLGQTVRRHSNDEIDLAVRLSKLGGKKRWNLIGLAGLSLLALIATVFALYHVVAGLFGQR